LEELRMQPEPNPEDINVILSRFQAWAEKHPVDGNGNGHRNRATSEEIREIPYEEAIRQHRSRHEGQAQKRPVPSSSKEPATSQQKSQSPASPSADKTLPAWITNLPVVPETEPAIEVKAAAPAAHPVEGPADSMPLAPASATVAPADRIRKSTTAQRAATAKATQPKVSQPAPMVALPEPGAQTSVDLPPILARQSKPVHRTPSRSQRTKMAAAASAPAVKTAAIDTRTSVKPAQATATSSLIGPAIRTGAPLAVRKITARRAASGPGAQPRNATRPPFRRVLTSTVQQPKTATATRKKPEPDRTRRITTRFSPTEERRIEKYAAERGVTISALLRECALSAIATPRLAPAATTGKRRTASAPARAFANKTYTAPAPFALGGWLALLRNRFLGPPVRFSGDA
jgi:hypothetical protein